MSQDYPWLQTTYGIGIFLQITLTNGKLGWGAKSGLGNPGA